MKTEIYKNLFWVIKRPRYYLKLFHSLKYRLDKYVRNKITNYLILYKKPNFAHLHH